MRPVPSTTILTACLLCAAIPALSRSGGESKLVGSTPNVQPSWNVDRHISLLTKYSRFYPGGFLKDNHLGKTVDFITTWADYKF